MLKSIIRKELLEIFLSFRFALALIMVITLFSTSAVIFNRQYNNRIESYRMGMNSNLDALKKASVRLSEVANLDQRLYLKPSVLEFIADGGEDKIWNAWILNAFSFRIPSRAQSVNWLLHPFDSLNFQFLISVILSFIVLIFTFDAITGEKRDGTLKLVLGNSISRTTVILGKFVSSLISIALILLAGFLLGLALILANKNIVLTGQAWLKILTFLIISLFYLSSLLLLGLLISSLTRNSVTSFFICMFLWLILVIVAPLAGNLLAPHFRPAISLEEMSKKMRAANQEIWQSAPEGAGGYNGSPTYPKMRQRTELINRLDESANQIKLDYIRKLITQAQGATTLSVYSPATIFRSSTEILAGSGLNHFAHFIEQGIIYQNKLLQFIKSKDSGDPDSYHFVQSWHPEAFSQKAVSLAEILQFEDKPRALGEILGLLIRGVGYLFFLNILFFAASFFSFIRYDVR